MKLATKKFFHNLLAIAVSVCMVCTLTPSVAWASSEDPDFFKPEISEGSENASSGDVGSSDSSFIGSDDGSTASGSTEVNAQIYDANFKFETLTPGNNYPSKGDLAEALKNAPLKATFNKSALPDKATVTWYVQEVIENPDYDPNQPVSASNPKTILTGEATPISTYTYTNPQETYEDGIPTFSYPPRTGSFTEPGNLPVSDGKMYEFSVILQPDGSDEQASAKTKITLLPDYPSITLHGVGADGSDDYVAQGNIYVRFSIPMTYPELSVTPSSNAALNAIQAEAASKGEEVSTAMQLALTGMDNLPDGKEPYLGEEGGNGLTLFIPLPEGVEANVGDDINVYAYNMLGSESARTAKTYPGEVVERTREDGTTYKAAAITVVDTGATLGSFAVGMPMSGSYTAYVSASEGGSITPSGTDGVVSGLPLGSVKEFSALAISAGYAFSGFEVRIGSATSSAVGGLDISGNVLKFNPVDFKLKDGDRVYIHANFTKVNEPEEGQTATSYNVSASLVSSDRASGTMTIGPAQHYEGAPDNKTINMGGSDNLSVHDYAGLFIKFAPNNGCTLDYVKVDGEDFKFDYASNAKEVMIGALTGNTTIEVSYRNLKAGETEPEGTEVTVTGTLDRTEWPTGYIRAMMGINGVPSQTEFTHDFQVPNGGTWSLSLYHTKNYRIDVATVDANGVETDVTNQVVTSETLDTINLHNVTSDMTVTFQYVPREADLTGTTGPGGTGNIVVDPTKQPDANSNMLSNSRLKARSVRAGQTVNIEGANQALQNGNRARISAIPDPGYELGRVEINGTNVTDFFIPHTEADGTFSRLTLTVYRTETGSVPADAGRWLVEGWEDFGIYDNFTDNVVPIEGSIVSLTMTFNPKVPTSDAYQTITTQVEGIGGSITPTFKVEARTTATVGFFPDDTYQVDAYRIDNGQWVTMPDNPGPDSLKCQVNVGTSDHTVTVRFRAGTTQNMPNIYTITPMFNAGGSLSPSQPVKVYDGDSFNFTIMPRTGYHLESDPTIEGSADQPKMTGYTCTVGNVKSDCNLVATFSPDEATDNGPTHIVKVRCVDNDDKWTTGYESKGGIVKPSNPFIVADGGDASFTFLPNDGWYVKGVYVVDSATPEANEPNERGINLVGSVKDGRMFTLRSIQADTQLEVVFGELSKLSPDEQEQVKPPVLGKDDTFTLDLKNMEIGEGATIAPELNDLVFVKAKDDKGNVIEPPRAGAGTDLTIIISSGYQLKDDEENGGITIKNGDKDVTGNITIKPAGDGLYEVKIPAENVTPDMKIVVNTKKGQASQGIVNKASVKVSKTGNGTISPAGIDGTVWVESGKSQTFSFIPDDGWKLYRVYVNDEAVNVTGNAYTIHNITGTETTLQAVFVEGQPDQPVVKHTVNIVQKTGNGTVTPSVPVQVVDGAALSILTEPDSGYRAVAKEVVNGTETDIPLAGNTIELSNIKSNRTINVYFENSGIPDFVSLVVSYGDGGTVSPAGNTLLAKDQTQTLSILPDSGKAVKDVWLTVGDGQRQNVRTAVKKTTDGKGIIYTTPKATQKMLVEVEFCNDTDSGRLTGVPTGSELRQPTGKDTYRNVTALVAGGGGTVVPTYAKVANGAPMTFTAVPLDGYHFLSATWNGTPVSLTNNNTTYVCSSVTSDSELRVVFEKDGGDANLNKYYTIFASTRTDDSTTTAGAKAGGTISPAGPVTVAGGGSQSFTIMPDPNCKVASIVISNRSLGGAPTTITNFTGSSYTLFGVSSDLSFTVTFTSLKVGETAPPTFITHSITASSSLNGSISPAGTRTVDHGGDAMFAFVPWDGYKLSYIIVDGVNIPASYITNMQYTFPKVTEDHSIHAVFIGENEKATDFATVGITSTGNGTVSPGGNVMVVKGENLTVNVTPFLKYKIQEIVVSNIDGESRSLGNGVDYTNSTTPISGSISSASYRWTNGQLLLSNVSADTFVNVIFAVDNNLPDPGETAPDYEKVTSKVSPPGTGETSLQPDPIHLVKPPTSAKDEQKKIDITIKPEEGKIAEEIVVDYGDGGKKVITDDGTYEYDKDGDLVDRNGNKVTDGSGNTIKYPNLGTPHKPTDPDTTIKTVYEKGYITVDADRGDIDVNIKFRDKTPAENSYNPATYLEVNVTYSAGGTVGPAGTIPVAKGSNLTLQMIPNTNYEVASVTVDGTNRTSAVYKDTRTYIETNIQTNKTINVAFGFVKSETPEPTYMLTAGVTSSSQSGTVSPAETQVREGSNQIVYFMPAAGYKIGKVTVTRGGDVQEYADYNSPSMAIRNINSDVRVDVEYVEGQNSWSVKSVPLTVEVGAGQGDVSPKNAEVPSGSAVEVNLFPADEWKAAYYTLNGQTVNLPQNVTSWPVTPVDGAENVMKVFFERIDSNGVDQIVKVKLIDSGDGSFHGSASPSQATVPYGGSTTFYVYPEVNAALRQGYTIDYVRFNGADQRYEGVINENVSNKQGFSVTNGNYATTGSNTLVSPSDKNALASSSNTYYSTYRVTLNDVVTSGTLEIKFKKIPNINNGTMVTTQMRTMTITSTGGGMVAPIGEVMLPEGESVDITTTTFESYYLASVVRTDASGKTDLTANVVGRTVKATMGTSDCEVLVTFNRVGETIADINVSLLKATYDGKDITDQVVIGGYLDPDTREPVATHMNADGVLIDSNGNPINFVRGGSYDFYFSTQVKGNNGRDLVLSSAKYAGSNLSFAPGSLYLTNVVLNSSGGFDLEFREVEEGEEPIVPGVGYTVDVVIEGNGTVDPDGWPRTIQPGGSVEIAMKGNAENYAVSALYLEYNDEYGDPLPPVEVSADEYATGVYRLTAIDRDYTIRVVFDEFSIVRVDWDNDLGFVTPNHAEGSYIYRPVGTANMDFLVAPYVDSELLGVYVGETPDAQAPLDPSDDPEFEDRLNAELGLGTQADQGIATMSMAEAPTTIVQPTTMDFAKVYGVTAPLGDRNTYVTADFKSNKTYDNLTITATVKGGHGTVDPSGDVSVPYGGTQTFVAHPDAGYVVVGLVVDGVRVPADGSVTFSNVTENHTVEFEFGLPQASNGNGGTGSSDSGADRLLRVASRLAQTGDLTGPAVGALLIVAAAGLAVTAVSYIRRQQRRRQRMQGMR